MLAERQSAPLLGPVPSRAQSESLRNWVDYCRGWITGCRSLIIMGKYGANLSRQKGSRSGATANPHVWFKSPEQAVERWLDEVCLEAKTSKMGIGWESSKNWLWNLIKILDTGSGTHFLKICYWATPHAFYSFIVTLYILGASFLAEVPFYHLHLSSCKQSFTHFPVFLSLLFKLACPVTEKVQIINTWLTVTKNFSVLLSSLWDDGLFPVFTQS